MWHLGKLYLVGGYTVEYDVELKSFYQGGSVLCNRFVQVFLLEYNKDNKKASTMSVCK